MQSIAVVTTALVHRDTTQKIEIQAEGESRFYLQSLDVEIERPLCYAISIIEPNGPRNHLINTFNIIIIRYHDSVSYHRSTIFGVDDVTRLSNITSAYPTSVTEYGNGRSAHSVSRLWINLLCPMSITMKLTFKLSKCPLVCKHEDRKELELHDTPSKHLPNK